MCFVLSGFLTYHLLGFTFYLYNDWRRYNEPESKKKSAEFWYAMGVSFYLIPAEILWRVRGAANFSEISIRGNPYAPA